jgi:hypothetical protein
MGDDDMVASAVYALQVTPGLHAAGVIAMIASHYAHQHKYLILLNL